MNTREPDPAARPFSRSGFDSPLLDEVVFATGSEEEGWGARLALLEAESPFSAALLQDETGLTRPAAWEEAFIDEEVRPYEAEAEESGPYEAAVDVEAFGFPDVRPTIEPLDRDAQEEAAHGLEEEACAYEEEAYIEAEAATAGKVVFPSGESLQILTGLPDGPDEDYWDPTRSGNPLLDTSGDNKNKRLSKDFTVRELATSGGESADVARIDPKLVQCLQRLRDRVGKAIKITSGYRSWKRNKAIYAKLGKRPTHSYHCAGMAADIKIAGMSPLEVGKAAIDAVGPNIGIGLAKTFTHIDVRGVPAAWDYAGVDPAWIKEIKAYQRGKGVSAGAIPQSGVIPPQAELVRFAQRILNAAEGERLSVDGVLGPLTGAALERFRRKYRLGSGGVLDETTELALAQRALEDLAQQLLFEKGRWDLATIQAITEFRLRYDLGPGAMLDAATRTALADAVERRAAPSAAVVSARPASGFLKDDPQLQTLALAPARAIVVERNWPASRRALAETYNRLGGLMGALATRLAIELAAVLAVWRVESGGRIHTPRNAIIRFENHLFFRLWGRNNLPLYDRHFRHGGHAGQPGQAWENHQYRENAEQPFMLVHSGRQDDEYRALRLAMRLAGENVALQCISIGGPQILISNHRNLGYATPRAMYEAFQSDERWHVLGFFDFCRTRPAPRPGDLIAYLRGQQWDLFARYYNGPGQVVVYGGKIGSAYEEARGLPAPSSRELGLEFV